MTKDVELHSDKWSKMTNALSSVTEHSTSTGSGYGNYSNQFSGDYGFSSTSKGFSKRIEPLETISERVQQLINEKDSDGVVSYSYHQMRSRAQELESKLSILENYSSNVPTYIKTKIDEPFYKAMDKVGEKLEALSIQKYKIPNTVGYKQVEPIKDDYQRVVGTKEVMPEEISINELYKLKNPYQLALQQSYSNYQNSKAYKEHPLTQEEYLTMVLNTRHFEYVSIDDEKSSIEMWRDFVIGAGIVALYIFCPPAGVVTNTVFAGLELSSAVSGKDWGTGRELDNGERALRGVFALIDLKEVGGLAKVAAKAGFAGVKMSLKTSLKEGLEQGAKNVDNFKGLWTGIKTYGDNFIHSIPEYSRQLTNQVKNFADEKVLNFSKVAQEGVERAKNFSLEIPTVGVVEDTFGGRQMMYTTTTKSLGDTSLGKGLDYIGSKANQVETGSLARLRARNAFYGNKVDDVVEAGSKASKDTAENIIRDGSHFDEFGNLRPNIRYQAGEFEYIYQTDDLGRLTNWDAEELHLTERTKRLSHDSNSPGKLVGDQAGHLAGDRFGGSPGKDNIVSQLRKVNLSDYKRLENLWAKALEEGKDVSVSVKLNYVGDSLRPDSFEVKCIIDGVPIESIIEN